MAFWVDDYLSATADLKAIEHGAYILLIIQYWKHGGLPIDEERLSIIARLNPREWKAHRHVLAALFEPGWRHKRIDEEIRKAEALADKRRKAGARGGWPNKGPFKVVK
jgi:uncharacterized protein YdaU (DUF1376 family)